MKRVAKRTSAADDQEDEAPLDEAPRDRAPLEQVRYGQPYDAVAIREALCRSSFYSGLQLIGDRWSVAVLRSAFLGARTFDAFRVQLRIPRQTLSERLRHLTDIGVFVPHPYQTNPPRLHYRLSATGRSLYPMILMTWAWRRDWAEGADRFPRRLIHKSCGKSFIPICVCATCQKPARLRDVRAQLRTSTRPPAEPLRSRRLASGVGQELLGDEAIALSLGVDRWAQLILAAIMLGCRRFDDLQTALGIGSNILSNRLDMLCGCAMLQREPDRFDGRRRIYKLTPMSEDLFQRMATLAQWHRALGPAGTETIALRHRPCASAFTPQVICDCCRVAVRVTDVRFG